MMTKEKAAALEAQMAKTIKDRIVQYGYTFFAVAPPIKDARTTLTHTIGLGIKKFPEIVVMGNVEDALAAEMIGNVLDIWLRDSFPTVGDLPDFFALSGARKVPGKLVYVNAEVLKTMTTVDISKHTGIEDFSVVQLYWPDENGFLPDHPHYTENPAMKQTRLPVA